MKLLSCFVVLVGLGVGSAWAGAKEGADLYAKACKSCHGAEGQGNPTIAKMMKVEIKPLSAPEVQAMSDAELRNIILKGKGKMKGVTSLTAKQADDIVAYMRTLKK